MEIYFDNSATTRVIAPVAEIVSKTMLEDYGNPSAMHTKGMEAENYIKDAKKTIADILKVQDKEIFFTSGGTESNNLAIIGTSFANQRKGKHIITSSIEHASVNQPMKFLEEQGFEITYLPVDRNGIVSLDALKEAIREDTILVSIMHVNNEIGAVQPIREIAEIVREKNPDTLFHVDSIQGFGKYLIYPKRWGIDLLSVSGHKIHGPKGVGFLYCREKTKIHPLILGGGQQGGMRSGTENVPGIAGIGVAAKEAYEHLEKNKEQMIRCKNRLIAGLNQLQDVQVNSKEGEESAPHIVSASFAKIRSEVLLHALEEQHIYVSAGSACSSNHPSVSKTLQAIGLRKDLLDCTLRFSFSAWNTEEEVDCCLEKLEELLKRLRLYIRK